MVEYEYNGAIFNGFLMLGLWFLFVFLCIAGIIGFMGNNVAVVIFAFLLVFVVLPSSAGFFVQQPNQARVFIFAGKYFGTCRKIGYNWVNPFFSKKTITLRISNMDVAPIKVNDKVGNPVMIGMVMVWRVCDTYKVIFDLNSTSNASGSINMSGLEDFVRIQSDAALREVTSCFPYDPEHSSSAELTLRNGGERINEILERKINERLSMAGLEVVEARINYLAYAPEIAAVMLRRQQASAVISAREKIVEGAVSMVEMALERLDKDNIVKLDESARAAMVSNLLVVLCSDEPANPVLNAGL
ncbi:MAG: SPFH domain-containing protein [Muribaculaceae bacterium]|nr:SPFH domain-containing protein [Muribaculaceae bacterium]